MSEPLQRHKSLLTSNLYLLVLYLHEARSHAVWLLSTKCLLFLPSLSSVFDESSFKPGVITTRCGLWFEGRWQSDRLGLDDNAVEIVFSWNSLRRPFYRL